MGSAIVVNRRRLILAHAIPILVIGGCMAPNRGLAPSIVARRAIERGSGLHVALVLNNEIGSATPIASNAVIAAAHCFDDSGPVGAVDGFPMMARHGGRFIPNPERPICDDWMILESTRNRFQTNQVVPTAGLKPGDRVVIGGYRIENPPNRRADFEECRPILVEGTVMCRRGATSTPDCVVLIRVPFADYHGMSGGPVALVGKSGALQVFGIVSKFFYRFEVLPPWRRYCEIQAVRLPESVSPSSQAGERSSRAGVHTELRFVCNRSLRIPSGFLFRTCGCGWIPRFTSIAARRAINVGTTEESPAVLINVGGAAES